MDYMVIDTSTQTMQMEHPTAESMLTAMTNPFDCFNGEPQIFELFRCSYQWYDRLNQEQAQKILKGALIAHQRDFTQQVMLYKEELLSIVTEDMAASAQYTIHKHPRSHKNFLYYHSDEEPMSSWQFKAPVQSNGIVSNRYEWLYVQLEDFPRLVPPHALEILAYLEQHRLTPQAYWVADKVKIAERISVDPILCAQYGRWFVGIAQWD